jgi:choice-of-anchor B domain-containing protein
MVSIMKIRHAVGALALGLVASLAIAHVDDPKLRDRQPQVPGPIIQGQAAALNAGFAAQGIALKSWLPLNNFTGNPSSANDCWGYVSPSGREYAIIGLRNGTGFVEITDPSAPVIVGHISGPSSLWRCQKVYGAYCYAGSEGGGGVQVISMTNIDGTNTSQPRVSLATTVTTGGTSPATHTLAIDTVSGYLYRAGGSSQGIRIYDVKTNPANPTFVGQWNNVYVHEAQVVTYTSGAYAGKQIAFCCGGANGGNTNTGLYVVDVTNKAAPVQLSYTTYIGARYCHQSWLSNDQRYVYINDELDEGATVSVCTTIVIDVRNLASPTFVGTFNNGNPSIGHNLYIGQGNRLFEANYRSGVRVFNLNASATNPPEVAWFDTYPNDDGAQFNGLWNVWPYFPSGTFIGSDIERGLFVWRFDNPSDLNDDGVINGADLGLILSGWGQPGASDINGDGITNGADVGLVLAAWGNA